jgi:hypothetical protein
MCHARRRRMNHAGWIRCSNGFMMVVNSRMSPHTASILVPRHKNEFQQQRTGFIGLRLHRLCKGPKCLDNAPVRVVDDRPVRERGI